jgi:hypothetical protein
MIRKAVDETSEHITLWCHVRELVLFCSAHGFIKTQDGVNESPPFAQQHTGDLQ